VKVLTPSIAEVKKE